MRRSKQGRPTRKPRPFGDGIDWPNSQPHEKTQPALVSDNDCKPSVEPFAPALEDRQWAENALRGVFDGPSFWDQLSAIAREFRGSGDEVCQFIGQELDRLVTTARLIGADGPDDFEVKRDWAETDAREAWEARGYESGIIRGREECGRFDGPID